MTQVESEESSFYSELCSSHGFLLQVTAHVNVECLSPLHTPCSSLPLFPNAREYSRPASLCSPKYAVFG